MACLRLQHLEQQGENVCEHSNLMVWGCFFAHGRSPLVVVQVVEVLDWPSRSPDLSPMNLILTVSRLLLLLSILQPTGENFFISLRISRCFVVLMQKKNHCLLPNIENLVAKIRSVKFSFLLSIIVSPFVRISDIISLFATELENPKIGM